MQKVHEIYLLRNKINGKGYVGQSDQGAQKRFKGHCYEAKNDSPKYLHKAMRKYGIENFELNILEVVETQAEADDAEVKWVAELKTLPHEWGYNLTTGGHKTVHTEESRRRNSESTKRTYQEHPELVEAVRQRSLGHEVSQESRDKASKTYKQKFIDNPELREEYGARSRGRKHSLEFAEACRQRALGRVYSEETNQKKRDWALENIEELRQRAIEQFSDPAAREVNSKKTKEYFEDPLNKEKTRQAMLKLYATKRVEKRLAEVPESFKEALEKILRDETKATLETVDEMNDLLVFIQKYLGEEVKIPKRRKKSLKLQEEIWQTKQ